MSDVSRIGCFCVVYISEGKGEVINCSCYKYMKLFEPSIIVTKTVAEKEFMNIDRQTPLF